MLDTIADLMDSRPHMRKNVQYTPAELEAYHEGYYTALVFALRCLDLAWERFWRYACARREANRRKRSA